MPTDGRAGPQTSEKKEMRSVAGQPRKSSCALWLIGGVVCPRPVARLSCRCDRGAGLTEPHQSGENIYDGGHGQRSSWVSCCVNNPSPPVNIFCLWGHLGLRRKQDRWQQSGGAKSPVCSPGGKLAGHQFSFRHQTTWCQSGSSVFQSEMSPFLLNLLLKIVFLERYMSLSCQTTPQEWKMSILYLFSSLFYLMRAFWKKKSEKVCIFLINPQSWINTLLEL